MTIPHFDDLTEPPVKGQFYMVRCVHGFWGPGFREGNWPVWGLKHEDAKFLNYPWQHYHLNRYFLSYTPADRATILPLAEGFPGDYEKQNTPLPEPVLRRRKCLWSNPMAFPTHDKVSNTLRPLYQSLAGIQCKRGKGWICPHKGFDLGCIASETDGYIQCPEHGLLINAETGIVAPRGMSG